jgi:hypothetical protein
VAIYSLHHTAIGKTTQAKPYTAAAHVKYIARPQALRHLEARRCPGKASAAIRYFREQEDKDRANARVADKLMLALPRELSQAQRVVLVTSFAEDMTKGRAPWLAAFHDKDKDADNPHCHLIIRDRDPKTRRRVIATSEPGSTERFRQAWERHANRALEMAGRKERIDRRTLRAQGVERSPTIHEGPRAQEMDARGAAPRSRKRDARNGPGAKKDTRQVDYPSIDQGLSRPEYNRMLRAQETESDFWSAIDQDTQTREFENLGYGEDLARRQGRIRSIEEEVQHPMSAKAKPFKRTHREREVDVKILKKGDQEKQRAPKVVGPLKTKKSEVPFSKWLTQKRADRRAKASAVKELKRPQLGNEIDLELD